MSVSGYSIISGCKFINNYSGNKHVTIPENNSALKKAPQQLLVFFSASNA
jgi:hypothetical protein